MLLKRIFTKIPKNLSFNKIRPFSMAHEKVPGDTMSAKKTILSAGTAMMQNFAPLKSIMEHTVGVHFYSGEVKRQVIAHHYCASVNDDFKQCLVYDSDGADARLIGVEFLISGKLFKALPDEEAKLWHSLAFEVKGGLLTVPRIPSMAEKACLGELATWYGKTIHFWQVDRGDQLPTGAPQLMMELTRKEDINWDVVKKRDQYYGTSCESLAKERADIETPTLDPRADSWEKTGKAPQFEIKEVSVSR